MILIARSRRSRPKKSPSQLSGGQRQRVALARALAFHPAAMLFDEPFSALDAVTRLELRREIRSLLREMNIPALFITHDQEKALELADRIVALNHGRIEQIGAPLKSTTALETSSSPRFSARPMLWSRLGAETEPGSQKPRAISLVDDSKVDGFPIVITRNKWDATDIDLSPGDLVVVGLKGYRLLPHYPLRSESGAKEQQQ